MAEFQLAEVRYPNISMAAFARSRGIPESTFRKGISREKRLKQLDITPDSKHLNCKVIELLEHTIALLKTK